MTGAMLRFELRALARDRAFPLLLAVVALVTALGTASGLAWQHRQQAALDTARAEAAGQLDHLRADGRAILAGRLTRPRYWNDPTDVRGFAYYLLTVYATKPPLPLSALTIGQGDLLPPLVKVSAGDNRGLASSYEPENPRVLAVGRLDAGFVVLFLLPLAIAAAAHNVLAQERESGRLATLALHGVSARRVTMVRLSLRATILGGVTATSLMVTLAIGGFDFAQGGGALLRWLGLMACYLLFWTGLAALVVAWSRRAVAAASALAALWLAIAVIGPWAIGSLAEALHPLPSRAEHILAMRDATDDAERTRAHLLGRYLVDHPEFVTADTTADASDKVASDLATRDYIEARVAAAEARFDARLAARTRLVDRLRWLSPPLLVEQAMTDLAGTGPDRHRAFLGQAHAEIVRLRAYFSPIVLSGDRTIRDWDGWPRYVWAEPSVAPARRQAAMAMLVLLAAAAASVAIAWIRLGAVAPGKE